MDAATRPLTGDERRYLEWKLDRESGGTVASLMKWTGGCTGCLLAPILAGLFFSGLLRELWGHGASVGRILLFTVPVLVWLGLLALFLSPWRKQAALTAESRARLGEDLAQGLACVHRFRADEILLGYGPRRGTRHYFIRLADRRVLYLGPWKPEGCPIEGLTFAPDERGFPSRDFEVATGLNSQLTLDVIGLGSALRPVEEFDLGLGFVTTYKLVPGDFVKVPWEDLRKVYG